MTKHIEEEDDGPPPEPMCKVWDWCHHPEKCEDECFDLDLIEENKSDREE